MNKINVLDKINHKKHGLGVIKAIDKNMLDFFYLVDFSIRGGDGTVAWLPKKKTEELSVKV